MTKWTKKSDPFLQMAPPLPCVIKMRFIHNHSTNTAASLRMLRVDKEVKDQYRQYFSMGMGATEAKHFHQSEILGKTDGFKTLADASKNPTQRQINHIYDIWRQDNLGSVSDPFEKAMEKVPSYEEKGCAVKILQETPWVILVVTPIMKRTQELSCAKEIIFMDSTASVEVSESTMTVLLAATNAGAIPIAALIHECQTRECYRKALLLLKNSFPNCFGGEEAPHVFMTDDSAAEKGAIFDVWPAAYQLLCQFHVAQAEWRWLHGKYSDVPLPERKRLMKLFQAVMYANCMDALEAALNAIREEAGNHSKFVERFELFFLRRDEWISLDRSSLLIRGNNTNNYSESVMRILKDVILSRMKAYNVTALIDYCVTTWEEDLTTKLLDFAHDRRKTPLLTLKAFSNDMAKFNNEDIITIDANTYIIPSATLKDVFYSVDTILGVCTCEQGMTGRFCKHQSFVMNHCDLKFPNAPICSTIDRHELGHIALGERCPPRSFFQAFKEVSSNETNFEISGSEPSTSQGIRHVPNQVSAINIDETAAVSSEEGRAGLCMRLNMLVTDQMPDYLVQKFSAQLDKVFKSHEETKTVQSFSHLLKTRQKRQKRINVQPTSVSRRRPGVGRGRKRIAAGRPIHRISGRVSQKRKRNLSENIDKNIPNAKSH